VACVDPASSLDDLPAIVLEAGGGCNRWYWAFVQERLAQRALVVSYDRAGLGRNTEWSVDMSAAGVARRLRALRLRAEIPPPYLLVGHSLGSLFVQYYAAKYRSEVAGLVLVDPMTSDCFRTACIVKDYSHGGLHWDPFSAASREFAAIGTTQKLVRRHPVRSDMPSRNSPRLARETTVRFAFRSRCPLRCREPPLRANSRRIAALRRISGRCHNWSETSSEEVNGCPA
jgi:pimeloyl-ACP methyl ester carboxylesterase